MLYRGAYTSTGLPIVTVRSVGSPKYAAGSAALCAKARKRTLRHWAIPGAEVRRMGPREMKYEALSTSTGQSEQSRRRESSARMLLCPAPAMIMFVFAAEATPSR